MHYKLGVRIQSSGQRMRWIDALGNLILRELVFNGFTYDVIVDKNLANAAHRCLTSATEDETHLLILQDDILPCQDLTLGAYRIIDALPNNIVTLFSNSEHVKEAYNSGLRYLEMKYFFMAQAFIIPVDIAKKAAAWMKENVKDSVYLDDERLATYCFYTNKKVYATAPSLVEHLGWDSTTLNSYKDKDINKKLRMANRFIGFEKSALEFDWSKTLALRVNDGAVSMFISNLNKRTYASKDD